MLAVLGSVLYLIWSQSATSMIAAGPSIGQALSGSFLKIFFALSLVGCIAAWWFVLERENRRVTQEESQRQNELLMLEIDAHQKTDAALKRATAAAESANQAKSRYVSGLSHELRTPLNSILGYTQLLLQAKEELTPMRYNAVRTIHRSGEHLLALVDGLLDIARIEAGKLQLNIAKVSLADFVSHLTSMLRPQALEKALAFDVQTVGRLPATVRTDQKCMSQILTNLIGNAIRFTPSGTITLRVSHVLDTLKFEVIDTGPGIPPAEMERLFLPFERGEAAHAYDHGAGLGLTICRLLTQALGGSLEVDSEVGHGTRFVVRLFAPAVDAAADTHAELASIRGYTGARRTILVVDDLDDQRDIVVQLLTPLGFDVAEAASGTDALRWLAMHTADAIIMDISMPLMDGYETSRLISENQLSNAPIVLLSANAFADDRDRASATGCKGYLVKPLQVNLLLDKLAQLLALDWIASDTGASALPAASTRPLTPAAWPRELVERLHAHLEVGYVQGVIERLDAARETWPELRDQIDALRALAERFQLRELEHELDRLARGANA
jgi:signal transduction histidine kinase/DNA-binding NarL/FixJ family response regulator